MNYSKKGWFDFVHSSIWRDQEQASLSSGVILNCSIVTKQDKFQWSFSETQGLPQESHT